MIAGLAALLLCQLAGEILVRALPLPLPGPVVGLGLMFAALALRGRISGPDADPVPRDLGRVCDALLANLSLLFVPAAVGVVQYGGLLRTYGWPIAVAIVASTTLTLAVTALTFRVLARPGAARRDPLEPDSEAVVDAGRRP